MRPPIICRVSLGGRWGAICIVLPKMSNVLDVLPGGGGTLLSTVVCKKKKKKHSASLTSLLYIRQCMLVVQVLWSLT